MRTHRYRRAIRQEPRARLSRDESQRAGADAGRGGWLAALGIELDRPLSRSQAWQARARRRANARAGAEMDGLAARRRRAGDLSVVLGFGADAAGETRPCGDRRRTREDR